MRSHAATVSKLRSSLLDCFSVNFADSVCHGIADEHHVLLCCLQILVVMGLLMRIIHVVPALAGLTVTIILVPITTVVSRRLSKVRRALIKCTDDRVKLVTEVITGVTALLA